MSLFPVVLAFIFWLPVMGQPDYSGCYGYGEQTPGAKTPAGKLVLLKMDGSTYRFWLDITRGGPGFERGETDGTFTIIHDTASFDNTFEEALHPCILHARFSRTMIEITHGGSSADCGFDERVYAKGQYVYLEKQDKLNNTWLQQQYTGVPRFRVTRQAALYRDENGVVPFARKEFIETGTDYLQIAETEKTIYTEFFGPDGRFRYGWVHKTAVKKGD